jgi:DNA helicase MCM9
MADFLLTSDPKSVTPAQYRKMLREFIEERLFNELEALVLKYSGPSEHFMFEVSCTELIDFDPSLGFNIIHFPKLLIPIFDEAIFEAQTNLCAHPALEAKNGRKGSVKMHCHIRIISLPPAEYLNKPNISDIRADDVDSLIQISGKVVRTGAVRMLEVSKKYECQNPRCQYRFNVLADPEQDNMLPQPRCCPSLGNETAGGNGKKCTSTNVRELEGHRVCVDYQELKIQDSFERVSLGSIPRSIIVILEADLVDKFNAGDDVVIVGVLVRQWKPVYKKSRCSVEIALKANSIQALNAQDKLRVVTTDTVNQFEAFWQPFHSTNTALKGRDNIIRSICPQLYGLFFVKLALLLTLVGGSATHSDRGVKRRSQSHLLVVGDPGCGKSQILRFAASVISRSVLTTGIGTSGAGLTCTAVRDGSDWSLEAGALVLANGMNVLPCVVLCLSYELYVSNILLYH